MDAMTTIMTAIAAAIADSSSAIVKDSYTALKALVAKKWGSKNSVSDALEQLERKPGSDGRRGVLQEELAAAGAPEHADLVAIASQLLEVVRTTEAGGRVISSVQQHVSGSHNAVVGVGTISVGDGRSIK